MRILYQNSESILAINHLYAASSMNLIVNHLIKITMDSLDVIRFKIPIRK